MYATEPPKKRVLHTSPEITWSLCDGCNSLEVTDNTRSKKYERTGKDGYTYKCISRIKNPSLTRDEVRLMTTEKCPLDKHLGRRGYE